MQSRNADAEEKIWMDLIGQLPCIVCEHFHEADDTPAETHHIHGKTKPKAHLKTIRLCANHHRHSDNHHPKRWLSRHGDGKAIFQDRYAPEMELLELQHESVESLKKSIV